MNAENYNGNNCIHVAPKFAKPAVLWEFRSVGFNDRDKGGEKTIARGCEARRARNFASEQYPYFINFQTSSDTYHPPQPKGKVIWCL